MTTNTKSLCLSFILATSLLFSDAKAQKISPAEQHEKAVGYWSITMDQVRIQVGATQKEFDIFTRFCDHSIDSIHIDFLNRFNGGIVVTNDAKEYMAARKLYFVNLFENFKKIEKEFPSSVGEYKVERPIRVLGDSCFTSCYNTGFDDGTLDGWYGYYGYNNSPDNNTGPFNITHITGGYCGAVTRAGGPDPYTGNDYQIRVTGGATTDPFLNSFSRYTMPEVSPWGGTHSVMLGDSDRYAPDYGVAILKQTFLVSPNTTNLTYQYALFLENPSGHLYYAQPFFSVAVLDQFGDTIPTCGQYSVSAQNHTGFRGVYWPRNGDSVYWKDWTLVNVPLKKYIGQCVTIIFQVQDCSAGGHFGYAYVDASCSPLQVIASSPNFCGQDSLTLSGPPGSSKYEWTGPTGGIRGSDSGQIVYVDSAGIYRLVTIPVTGAACADTLYDTIGKIIGNRPKPQFKADTVCVGQITTFKNTSLPNDSGIFSWDFYNVGLYNYTNIAFKDTEWTYASAGIYTVKLHELLDGCGYDTIIKVPVDTAVSPPTVTWAPVCYGDTTYFTSNAAHAKTYHWNFGDLASGIHNTSTLQNPAHLFSAPGTFTVSYTATNVGACGVTGTYTVTIGPSPKPIITGPDSTCVGSSITLSVTGGTTYRWSPSGLTTTSISFTATSSQTISVQANDGLCPHDTSFSLTVVPDPTASIKTSKDSVCSGDSLTLEGSSGIKYRWKPGGQTTSVIHVSPASTTTYTLYTYASTCVDSTTVTIPIMHAVTATAATSVDSICPGQSATLTATGSGGVITSYLWAPGGYTTATINVSPPTTQIYTVTVTGDCNSVQKNVTVTVVPYPAPVISGTNFKCFGVRDTLFVSNATSPTTYLWSNGKTTTKYVTGPIKNDSTITVTAYNALGCPHDTTFTIFLRIPPTVTITPPAIFCAGSPITLVANATGTNSPFVYNWSTGQTGSSITINPGPDIATTYNVSVSNGCQTTRGTTVTPNFPVLAACCNQTLLVQQSPEVLNDTTILVATGNSIKYQWSESPTNGTVNCLDPACDSVKVIAPVTTTYTVIGTDSLGCTSSQILIVTVDVPCFNLNVPNVFTPTMAGPAGLDNRFYIKTENFDGWAITIYDRWGKEMFTTTNQFQYWTGTTEGGGDAPSGVYYYVIHGTCQGTTYTKDGFLQLIR